MLWTYGCVNFSQVGDQVLSINGNSTEGVTHMEAVRLLKQVARVTVLEVLHHGKLLHSTYPTCI